MRTRDKILTLVISAMLVALSAFGFLTLNAKTPAPIENAVEKMEEAVEEAAEEEKEFASVELPAFEDTSLVLLQEGAVDHRVFEDKQAIVIDETKDHQGRAETLTFPLYAEYKIPSQATSGTFVPVRLYGTTSDIQLTPYAYAHGIVPLLSTAKDFAAKNDTVVNVRITLSYETEDAQAPQYLTFEAWSAADHAKAFNVKATVQNYTPDATIDYESLGTAEDAISRAERMSRTMTDTAQPEEEGTVSDEEE